MNNIQVVSNGAIPFPMPAPGGSWSNAANFSRSNTAFSPVNSDAFSGVVFSNGLGNPLLTYLVRLNRTNNTATYSLLYTGDVANNTFYQLQLISVSLDGTHLYLAYNQEVNGSFAARFEKRLASDFSLQGTLTISGIRGLALDMDVANIGGVEYWAVTNLDVSNVSDYVRHLTLINTSTWAITFDKIVDPATSTALPPLPCAFDTAGNVWWIPLSYGTVVPNELRKVTVT